MKIYKVEQGSEEWLKLRREHVCATDTGIILGVNPWNKNIYKLYQEKMDEGAGFFETEHMRKGKENEIVAREKFNQESEYVFVPQVGESDHFPYLLASLDGLNFDGDINLEIKSFDTKGYEKALNTDIPPHYMTQVQTGLIVNDQAKKCIYLCSNWETGEYFVRDVFPNIEMQNKIIQTAHTFWDYVVACKELKSKRLYMENQIMELKNKNILTVD